MFSGVAKTTLAPLRIVDCFYLFQYYFFYFLKNHLGYPVPIVYYLRFGG